MTNQIDDKLRMRIEILLTEYSECASDHRHYSSLIWQVPAVALVIGGTLLALAFSVDINRVIRPFIIFIGMIFVIVLTVAVERYRMFELARRKDLEDIEETMKEYGGVTVYRGGKEIISDATNRKYQTITFIQKKPAFQWLRIMMYILIGVIGLGLAISIVDVLNGS